MINSSLDEDGSSLPKSTSRTSTPTPKKPDITPVPLDKLLEHYHSQLDAYNAAADRAYHMKVDVTAKATILARKMKPLTADEITKEELIELIRRQNFHLGRHIVTRAHELLLHCRRNEDGSFMLDGDKRTIGYSYSEILEILAYEHPEASTTAACLRWYIVHIRDWYNTQGIPWSDASVRAQVRPRSSKAKKNAT